ncbi:hypothetical protein CGZ98_13080 [Enemella evansiae]|uniref:hypothetical protein n=2 Tax=Enemella evansiae TaxID=2016499 RepID=UPI000B96EC0B|nr:hypothetical protein [Enemella evansiae]OYO10029.1 hypothetical protein CGZ98_13080 [Enemella evansiae]
MKRKELLGDASAAVNIPMSEAVDLWSTDPDRAEQLAEQAWQAIPEPREQWLNAGSEVAGSAAEGELSVGRHEAAAKWLERYREVADPDNRDEQASYWALVGRLSLAMDLPKQAVAALDREVELNGYFYELSDHLPVLAKYRELKGLPVVRMPAPWAESGRRPPEELGESALAQLQTIYDEAAGFDDQEQHREALAVWEGAWDVIPAPTQEWSWSATIYGGMGESLYWLEDYPMAELAFQFAMRCPGGEQPVGFARLAQSVEKGRGDKKLAEEFWAEAEAAQPGIRELANEEV